MTRLKLTTVPLGAVLAALTLGMGAANAKEVYQGNDVSYGSDANRRAVVCDEESDDAGVHTDFYSFAGQAWRIDDLDGFGGACWASDRMTSGLAKHRTVEEVGGWKPDYKSAWSYH